MQTDRFIELAIKDFTGTLSAAEATELGVLLQQPNKQEVYGWLQKFWNQSAVSQPDPEVALANVWARIRNDEPMPETQPRRRRWWPVVAAASVVAAAAVLWLQPFSKKESVAIATQPVQNGVVQKQNGKGTRSVITLADGSKVWLNADSRLQYPDAFAAHTREVELVGEAFFDVTKNPNKPFIIHLANGTVRVLGTSFNVKAYPAEGKIETSVATGRVAFIPNAKGGQKAADTTFLTPNQKAVYLVGTVGVKTVKTSSADDKAWTEGKLIFNATTMDEVAAQLERYFGKQVVILDDELRDYRFTGPFENNSAEEILYYLSKTKPFTYRITDAQIILSLVR